jgi:hypothetical protein
VGSAVENLAVWHGFLQIPWGSVCITGESDFFVCEWNCQNLFSALIAWHIRKLSQAGFMKYLIFISLSDALGRPKRRLMWRVSCTW